MSAGGVQAAISESGDERTSQSQTEHTFLESQHLGESPYAPPLPSTDSPILMMDDNPATSYPLLPVNSNFQHQHSTTGGRFNIVKINVAGKRFETLMETLERFPNSLLGHPGKRQKHYNAKTGEYFFDRHRHCFESILYIYQSEGRVKRADGVPMDVFIKELKFFEMGDDIVEKFWISEGYQKPDEVPMPSNRLQRAVWELMEYPDSSVSARILAFISVFVIVVSIVSFCLETIPELRQSTSGIAPTEDAVLANSTARPSSAGNHSTGYSWSNPFNVIESVCILWFTVEFVLRFVSSPSKLQFAKSWLNIIDFVAIAPFFINLIFPGDSSGDEASGAGGGGGGAMSFAVLRVLRLVRVFRIFKLSRHSVGLQILAKTFAASTQEFCLLVFFMCIALVLFSSGIYFAESGQPNTKFRSIPDSFWFTLVTMTTVGYGDMAPEGVYGKIVGGMTALIGVLTLALPVPIIVANFKHFYRQETRLAQMRAYEDAEDTFDDASNSD